MTTFILALAVKSTHSIVNCLERSTGPSHDLIVLDNLLLNKKEKQAPDPSFILFEFLSM